MDSTDECGGKREEQPKCHRNSPRFIDRITIDVRRVKEVRNVELINAQRNLSSSPSIDRETTILTWQQGDPDDPHNWSTAKKTWIFITLMLIILNSCIGSSLTSNGIPFIVKEFGVKSQPQRVLPISVYLIGYVFGPIVWAPLSEQFGRRDITIGTFILFVLFTMACALAPSWPTLLIFRLLSGVFASAPIAVVTGILADIYQDSTTRGRSIAVYMIITAFGPLIAPILSGFVSPTLGWRWSFWIALMFAGCTLVPLVVLPETNAAVLLRRRATNLHGSQRSLSKLGGLENRSTKISITTLLMRPLHMLVFEPITSASSAYLALCYSIFYMSFQAFPIIFQDLYGLSPGTCGLTYLPIGAGVVISLPILWWYDRILLSAQKSQRPWAHREEYRRLPIACLGGPIFALSLFWLGWSARESVSFVVPMLAGIPFGFGFICIFIALLNYLTDAYEIYAASANAASSFTRSLLATVLPLATTPMFEKLGIAGACSLMGGITALMCIIPFIFIWKGDRIRANSKFCIMLKKRKEERSAHLANYHYSEETTL